MKKQRLVEALRLIILFSAISLGTSSCTFVRYFWWNFADINDMHKFPAVAVHTAGIPFQFAKPEHDIQLTTLPGTEELSFNKMLADNGSLAFLIVRNDSLIFEKYLDGMSPTELVPTFSISKSFVGTLTGIAIAEGKIKDTRQTVKDFLPWMNNPGFEKITIEDLLNMRSGIDFQEKYNTPFADMPKYYYGKDLKRILPQLKVAQSPDLQYDYVGVNTLLLGLIIEKAVGKPLNKYLEEKLWIPMAMESDANWNIDSKKSATIKSFCCLNAIARDLARYGRLYLKKGNWDGKQLVPDKWIEKTMSVVNDSRDSEGFSYTYCWRVTPKGAIYAKGILGQYVYVYPKKNIIIVRLGKKQGDISWSNTFEKIVDHL